MKEQDIEYINKYYKGEKNKALMQLQQGRPVQYIVGNVDFYGYIIKVDERVLIPRFETEELVKYTIEYTKKNLKEDEITILDIGTGSGCIAIALKKELQNANVTAIDISEDALDVAIENAKINNVDINFKQSDIFENINEKYNIIISNPPYIKTDEEIEEIVKNNEPHLALYAGKLGLDIYIKIINNIKDYLQKKYIIAFEIGNTQAQDIINIIKDNLKDVKIILKKDIYERDRFIFILKE